MNNTELKLIEEGNKIWEAKDIKRIYINNILSKLDIVGKNAYDNISVEGIDLSKYCLSLKRAFFDKYILNDTIKVYYDCVEQKFNFTTKYDFLKELGEKIVEKLNNLYSEENIENNISSEKVETMITNEEYNVNDIINYNNKSIKIINKELLTLSKNDVECIYGGCFVDNEEDYLFRRNSFRYSYIEM